MPDNKLVSKPTITEKQVDMLWDACFNHIPSRLDWMNTKINFILTFLAIELALTGLALTLLIAHIGG